MSPPRILLSGDVLGRLTPLYKRFHTVNKASGPFDALLCVGQFFPDSPDAVSDLEEYVSGRVEVPVPTYFTGDYGVAAGRVLEKAKAGSGFKMNGVEVCRNLFWLRGSGRFELQGLSVAYLSGKKGYGGAMIGVYSEDDVGALRALAEEPGIIDIFLTNEWPSGVAHGADTSGLPQGVLDPVGSDHVISELVAEIKPRYHIAGAKSIYFVRDPYSNDKAAHTTRFIGLATVGNKDKQKFLHAISPTPAAIMSTSEIQAKPPNTTLSPYIVNEESQYFVDAAKRPLTADVDSQYWRFDASQKRQRQDNGGLDRLCFKFTSTGSCPRGGKCNFRHDEEAGQQYLRNVCFDFLNKGKCERGPDCKFRHSLSEEGESISEGNKHSDLTSRRARPEKRCWFCLSSPDVETHLITSVGESCYCALPKGPLVQGHVLLVPIEHCPSTFAMVPEADIELGKLKEALKLHLKSLGKAVVFYEWVSPRTSHANLQAVPVPSSRAADAQRAFSLAAKRLGFEFEVLSPGSDPREANELLRSEFDKGSSFFYVELPEGKILKHTTAEQDKFPVQFGREVIAGMLNLADRADWRNCTATKEEEINMVEEFKKDFEKFDPTK